MSTDQASPGISLVNLLVCDGAHRDPGSGKWTLMGLFDGMTAVRFPSPPYPQIIVYLVLAGADGKVPLRVQFASSDRKDEPIGKIEAELTVRDKRFLAEIPLPVQGLVFPKPGDYAIQVFANNKLVGERMLKVAQTAPRV